MNYFPISSKQRKRDVSSSLAASYCFFLFLNVYHLPHLVIFPLHLYFSSGFWDISSDTGPHIPLAGGFYQLYPNDRRKWPTQHALYTTRKANQLLSLLKGSRKPESRGVGNVSICPNFARTAAVDVLFSIDFAVVFDFIYFRFRPSKAKWIGNVLPNRWNAAIRSMFIFPFL